MSAQVQHDLHPAIVKSHEVFDTVWKTLPAEQKEAIKELVQAIGQLEDRVGEMLLEAPRFAEPIYEAHTNTHGSLVSPRENGAGVVWEIIARGDTPTEILDRMIVIQGFAQERGFIPADKYVDQRRQERKDTIPFSFDDNKPERYLDQRQQTPPVVTSQPTGSQAPIDTNGHPSTPAQSIVAAPMSDKKPDLIWKIRTSKSKFPVPIYEAIEGVKPALMTEGVDLSTFVTPEGKLREYQLSGWMAFYEQNEKGYPSKVIQLVKAG